MLTIAEKRRAMRAKVAGPWMDFNKSAHAVAHRTGWGGGCTARFTPVEKEATDAPVVKVWKRWRQPEPQEHHYHDGYEDESYVTDNARWEAAEYDREFNPYGWEVDFYPHTKKRGSAPTHQEAQDFADAWMRKDGWALYDEDEVTK
jgi:hypothetical protein